MHLPLRNDSASSSSHASGEDCISSCQRNQKTVSRHWTWSNRGQWLLNEGKWLRWALLLPNLRRPRGFQDTEQRGESRPEATDLSAGEEEPGAPSGDCSLCSAVQGRSSHSLKRALLKHSAAHVLTSRCVWKATGNSSNSGNPTNTMQREHEEIHTRVQHNGNCSKPVKRRSLKYAIEKKKKTNTLYTENKRDNRLFVRKKMQIKQPWSNTFKVLKKTNANLKFNTQEKYFQMQR